MSACVCARFVQCIHDKIEAAQLDSVEELDLQVGRGGQQRGADGHTKHTSIHTRTRALLCCVLSVGSRRAC